MPRLYAKGLDAWGHCQRCGFRFKLAELVADGHIRGLQVCRECWDPQHPQERIPPLSDAVALRNATGDMDKEAASALPEEITLTWSVESITAIDGTADVAYTNATAPVALSVHFIESFGLEVSFDGTTATVTAGTAEPGDISATLRATLTDSQGRTKTADLPVSVTVVEPVNITVLNVAISGDTDQVFLHSNGGPNGMTTSGGFPPFSLGSPTFQELFPAWNYSDPLIPEDVNYPDMYIVTAPFGPTNFDITVEIRGAVADDWAVSDASSAHVSILSVDTAAAAGTNTLTFTVQADPGGIIGDPRTGEIQVQATVGAEVLTATIYFGFTLAGF